MISLKPARNRADFLEVGKIVKADPAKEKYIYYHKNRRYNYYSGIYQDRWKEHHFQEISERGTAFLLSPDKGLTSHNNIPLQQIKKIIVAKKKTLFLYKDKIKFEENRDNGKSK